MTTSEVPAEPDPEGSDASISDVSFIDQADSANHEFVFSPDSSLRNPRKLASDIAYDIWMGRELAWRMFVRNIRGLYRQTVLGLFWAFLPPLANTAVWVILNWTKSIKLDSDMNDISYAAYVMAGMVVWQSFIEAFQGPLLAVQANKNMLSKLRFPRESILMVRMLEVLFNLFIRLLVLVPVLLLFGGTVSGWVFLAPLPILFLVLLGFALGLLIMPFGMLYHDISRFVLVAIPVWMIITPIVYLPNPEWSLIYWINPAAPLLMVARDLFVFGQTEFWVSAAVYAGITLPLFLIGLLFYRLSVPILVERVSG